MFTLKSNYFLATVELAKENIDRELIAMHYSAGVPRDLLCIFK